MMYKCWIICMLLFVLQSQGATTGAIDRLKQQNIELKNANSVLQNTLRQLAPETRVGVNSVVSGSEAMVGKTNGCDYDMKKSCTGTRIDLRWFNREQQQTPAYGRDIEDWCLKQCEYFGLNGCCEYLLDENQCYFQLDGTVQDDDYNKQVVVSPKGVYPWKYETIYYRYGGNCEYNGDLIMKEYKRSSGCEWNMGDDTDMTTFKQEMSGSSNSEAGCKAWCFNLPNCNFAQLKNGVCQGFRTCTNFNNGYQNDWKMWQKVYEAAPIEWSDASYTDEPPKCPTRCYDNRNKWVGDGECDRDCGDCKSYNTNGLFDGGDCL